MSRVIKAEAGTAAIITGSEVPFTIPQTAFKGNSKPTIAVQGLATGETVTIKKYDGVGYQSMVNGALVFGTNGSTTFESPGQYGFIKTITAAAIKLVLDDGR